MCTYNQCGKFVRAHYVHVWLTIGQGAKQAVNCAIPGRASGDHCVHTVIIACTLDYVPLVSREKGGLQSQGPALLGKCNRSICQTKIMLNLVFSYLIMYIYWLPTTSP